MNVIIFIFWASEQLHMLLLCRGSRMAPSPKRDFEEAKLPWRCIQICRFCAFLTKFLFIQRFLFIFHDAAFALKKGRSHWHLTMYHIDTNFNEGVVSFHSDAKGLVYWIDGMSAPKTYQITKNTNNFILLKKFRIACANTLTTQHANMDQH